MTRKVANKNSRVLDEIMEMAAALDSHGLTTKQDMARLKALGVGTPQIIGFRPSHPQETPGANGVAMFDENLELTDAQVDAMWDAFLGVENLKVIESL